MATSSTSLGSTYYRKTSLPSSSALLNRRHQYHPLSSSFTPSSQLNEYRNKTRNYATNSYFRNTPQLSINDSRNTSVIVNSDANKKLSNQKEAKYLSQKENVISTRNVNTYGDFRGSYNGAEDLSRYRKTSNLTKYR